MSARRGYARAQAIAYANSSADFVQTSSWEFSFCFFGTKPIYRPVVSVRDLFRICLEAKNAGVPLRCQFQGPGRLPGCKIADAHSKDRYDRVTLFRIGDGSPATCQKPSGIGSAADNLPGTLILAPVRGPRAVHRAHASSVVE